MVKKRLKKRVIQDKHFLQSAQLLGDACVSFDEHCAIGIEPNYPRIKSMEKEVERYVHDFCDS